jgi:hypothetical protein
MVEAESPASDIMGRLWAGSSFGEGLGMTELPNRRAAELKGEIVVARSGAAIAQFATLETTLGNLFAECIGFPVNVSAQILIPVLNFSTKLDIIDVVVRHKLQTSKATPYWLSLLDYIRELSGDRNYLAHTPLMYHRIGGEPADDPPLEPQIGPHVGTFLAGQTPRHLPIPLEEVEELVRDFTEAKNFVIRLSLAIMNASLDTLAQPIVRRRPPRGIRQGAVPPA